MIRVVSIADADFGCEGRPGSVPELCSLELNRNGELMILNVPARRVDELGLKPGTELSAAVYESLAGR